MERKFEIDDKVYFTCFQVFVAGVALMGAASFSETSESIILSSLFFFRQIKWKSANNMQHFLQCVCTILKKKTF
jgi:hypothetical protein